MRIPQKVYINLVFGIYKTFCEFPKGKILEICILKLDTVSLNFKFIKENEKFVL